MFEVTLTQEELGLLAICAVRYCQGRQTYMPKTIQDICLKHINEFSDKDLGVLVNDFKSQTEFGDPNIDYKDWVQFGKKLHAEQMKRLGGLSTNNDSL